MFKVISSEPFDTGQVKVLLALRCAMHVGEPHFLNAITWVDGDDRVIKVDHEEEE